VQLLDAEMEAGVGIKCERDVTGNDMVGGDVWIRGGDMRGRGRYRGLGRVELVRFGMAWHG